MIDVGIRVYMDDFLCEVSEVCLYDRDGSELDPFIYYWQQLRNSSFLALVVKAINFELERINGSLGYDDEDSDDDEDLAVVDENFQFNMYSLSKEIEDFDDPELPLSSSDFEDFCYCFLRYISHDIHELDSEPDLRVRGIELRRDLLSVTVIQLST